MYNKETTILWAYNAWRKLQTVAAGKDSGKAEYRTKKNIMAEKPQLMLLL